MLNNKKIIMVSAIITVVTLGTVNISQAKFININKVKGIWVNSNWIVKLEEQDSKNQKGCIVYYQVPPTYVSNNNFDDTLVNTSCDDFAKEVDTEK